MKWVLLLAVLLLASPAAALETVWGQASGGTYVTQDLDGDGKYEFARADTDWDNDGTSWKTCDCGGSTTPAFDENYICGTYRTSSTDDSAVDYSAGDSADNPAECRFHGERIWDDITDDIAALESQLTVGSVVYFPPGIYPPKGSLDSDTSACWNSAAEDWTDTCLVEGATTTSAILMRKDGLIFRGGGADGNGEKDLKREGTWIALNRGLTSDWSGTPSTLPRTFCMGYLAAGVGGSCGLDLFGNTGSAEIMLTIQGGSCIDQNDTGGPPSTTADADGDCDVDGSTSRVDTQIADRNQICVDDSGSFVTDNLSAGDFIAVGNRTVSGQNDRTMHRILSVGASCGSGSAGLLLTLGGSQMLEDLGGAFDFSPPHNILGQIYGADSALTAEANVAGLVYGPIEPERMVSNLVVENFTFASHNYVGDGVCTDGTEAACDEGSALTPDSGRGNIVRNNAFVHGNSDRGSAGLVDGGPYNVGLKIQDNVFRFNGGGSVIDIGSGVLVKNNVFEDNTVFQDTASQNGFLLGNQGGLFVVDQNVFARNHIAEDEGRFGGIVAMAGPYSYITRNQFLMSEGPCVKISPGAMYGFVTDNIFQCGQLIGTDDLRADIMIAGNTTDEAVEMIDISRNQFLAGGGATGDDGETMKIFIQTETLFTGTDDGQLGPGGLYIHDNMVNMDSATSAFIVFRADDDPDAGHVFITGNTLTQGKIAAAGTMGANAFFNLDGDADGTVGLPVCGVNRVAGAITGAVANQCVGAWTIP